VGIAIGANERGDNYSVAADLADEVGEYREGRGDQDGWRLCAQPLGWNSQQDSDEMATVHLRPNL
jgi:hypothetical protein